MNYWRMRFFRFYQLVLFLYDCQSLRRIYFRDRQEYYKKLPENCEVLERKKDSILRPYLDFKTFSNWKLLNNEGTNKHKVAIGSSYDPKQSAESIAKWKKEHPNDYKMISDKDWLFKYGQ